MASEHPRRENEHAALAAHRPVEIGIGEDEQRLDRHAGDAFDELALRVSLLEHRWVDPRDRQAPAVALRLDSEEAARADQHVVDVPAAKGHVVDRPPPTLHERLEQFPDVLLTLGAAIPAVDDRKDEPIDEVHTGDGCELDEHEGQRPPTEGEPRDHRDRDGPDDRHQRPDCKDAHVMPCMLACHSHHRHPSSAERGQMPELATSLS
jgi:hypothetical protein